MRWDKMDEIMELEIIKNFKSRSMAITVKVRNCGIEDSG